MKRLIPVVLVLNFIFSSMAKADALIGFDYILFTDKTTVETSTSAASAKTMYLINIQFTVNQRKSLFVGWGLYNVATKDEVNQQESNYATQDMGPSLRYEFGRSGLYFINFVYGIRTVTTYDSGGTAESWLGTNYLAQLGVNPAISENFYISFAFNFFTGAAITKVVSSVQTDVSYSKAFMTPTVGMNYKW